MWPAKIFANNRIINTKGRITMLDENSIKGMSGIGNFNHHGTPGVLTMCTQKNLLVVTIVIIKVMAANTMVIEMFPVTLAPPGKMGIKPMTLLISMKKKTVNK